MRRNKSYNHQSRIVLCYSKVMNDLNPQLPIPYKLTKLQTAHFQSSVNRACQSNVVTSQVAYLTTFTLRHQTDK